MHERDVNRASPSKLLDLQNPGPPLKGYFTRNEKGPNAEFDIFSEDLERLREHNPASLQHVTSILGDASRNFAWGEIFVRNGILDFVTGNLKLENDPNLSRQELRIIGNCCAGVGDSCQSILKPYLGSVIECLQSEELLETSFGALRNICVSSDDLIQEAIVTHQLHKSITRILAHQQSHLEGPSREHALELISILAEHLLDSDYLTQEQSPQFLTDVLDLAPKCEDLDVYLDLIKLCLVYVKGNELRKLFLQPDQTMRVLSFLENIQDRHTDHHHDEEETQNLHLLFEDLANGLVNLSAEDEWIDSQKSNSEIIDLLTTWLRKAEQLTLATCACILLGNIATSDSTCTSMARYDSLPTVALDVLRTSADRKLLHAVAGLWRHLMSPKENKALLGQSLLMPVQRKLLSVDDPDLNYAGLGIIRQIVRDSAENSIYLLNLPVQPGECPYVSELLARFELIESTSPQKSLAKIETGRIVVALLRSLPSEDGEPSAQGLHLLTDLPGVAHPLLYMIKSGTVPACISEGWFGLTIMSRSYQGARAAFKTLEGEGGFDMLKNAVESTPAVHENESGESLGHEVQASSKDRENALLMTSQLLQHLRGEMTSDRRETLEKLLRDGLRDRTG